MENHYIDTLKAQNKLNLSADKSIDYSFKFGEKTLGKDKIVIAGPCSFESGTGTIDYSKKLKDIGADGIRGGLFKPATFPVKKAIDGWKEGVGMRGLTWVNGIQTITNLPVVVEAMSVEQANILKSWVNGIQVGARNFQNYSLLDYLGKIDNPIFLKRGTWGTLDEILGAAERILLGGNKKVCIVLRGVVGMPSYRHVFPSIRWAPDLMMIPALKEFTTLPILFDPSHSTGKREFVIPMSKAAIAAGADGIIVESHPDPLNSISDAAQAIGLEETKEIIDYVHLN